MVKHRPQTDADGCCAGALRRHAIATPRFYILLSQLDSSASLYFMSPPPSILFVPAGENKNTGGTQCMPLTSGRGRPNTVELCVGRAGRVPREVPEKTCKIAHQQARPHLRGRGRPLGRGHRPARHPAFQNHSGQSRPIRRQVRRRGREFGGRATRSARRGQHELARGALGDVPLASGGLSGFAPPSPGMASINALGASPFPPQEIGHVLGHSHLGFEPHGGRFTWCPTQRRID